MSTGTQVSAYVVVDSQTNAVSFYFALGFKAMV